MILARDAFRVLLLVTVLGALVSARLAAAEAGPTPDDGEPIASATPAATVANDALAPASADAMTDARPARHAKPDGLEHLVPALAGDPYRLASGRRPYLDRVSFSPSYGLLGNQKYFALHLAFNPNPWLGYEATIGHNPAKSVHAVLNMLSANVRYPLAGRFQPYGSLGYGMLTVYPGQSINADPVTKNALAYGGGLEFFIRDDLALRGEVRQATVFGSQRDREGTVVYDYLQETIGIAFYRSIKP